MPYEYEYETGFDSQMDVNVEFPDNLRDTINIDVMDINGTDYTVEHVKQQILKNREIQDHSKLKLAFRHNVKGSVQHIEQKSAITNYLSLLKNCKCGSIHLALTFCPSKTNHLECQIYMASKPHLAE